MSDIYTRMRVRFTEINNAVLAADEYDALDIKTDSTVYWAATGSIEIPCNSRLFKISTYQRMIACLVSFRFRQP